MNPGPIRMTPLAPGCRLSVTLDPAPAWTPADQHEADERERAWAALRASNPRYHDGPLLAVHTLDPERASIVVRAGGYKSFAVQPTIETGVRLFAVNGILRHRERDGTTRVLLAQRSETTRAYPGLWEFAPAGGVELEDGDDGQLDDTCVISALVRESEEELGIDLHNVPMRPIALLEDEDARSVDVIVLADCPRCIAPASDRWEYADGAWMSVQEACELRLSPPARAMLPLLT